VFKVMTEKVLALDGALGARFNAQPRQPTEDPVSNLTLEEIFKCPKCNRCSLALKQKKDNAGYYLSCLAFPDCKNTIWLADMIREVTATSEVCPKCGPGFRKLKFKFKQQHTLALLGSDSPTHYTACLVCDGKLRDLLNINVEQVKRVGGIVGAGAPPRAPVNPVTNRPATTNTRPPPPSRNTNSQPVVAARATGGGGWNNSSGTAPTVAPGSWGSSGGSSGWGASANPSLPNTNASWSGTNNSSGWGSSSGPVNPPPVLPNPSASWNGTNNTNNNSSGWGSSSGPVNPPPVLPNPTASWNGTNNTNNNRRQSAGSDGLDCPKCNIPARKLTVKKDGPNKGRKFYLCPNKDDPNSSCNFFKWADEVDGNVGGSGGGGGGPGPGPGPSGKFFFQLISFIYLMIFFCTGAPSWSRNNNNDDAGKY
jgi:DNA topoisomerase III